MKNKQQFVAYEPYVREMNLWIKNVDEVQIIAPFSNDSPTSIDAGYIHNNIELKEVKYFDITSIKNSLKSIFVKTIIIFNIFVREGKLSVTGNRRRNYVYIMPKTFDEWD